MTEHPCAWRTVHECRGDVHLYLAGWLCQTGAPPPPPVVRSTLTPRIAQAQAPRYTPRPQA